MKKLTVLVVALVATLAFGAIAATAAQDKVTVKSKVTLKYKAGEYGEPPYYGYPEAVFKGKVGVKGGKNISSKAKKKCKKKRTVVVKQVGGGKFGTTKTDKTGRYSLDASDAYTEPGDYVAKAKKKKKGKVLCKKAKSKPVTVT
jgi:glutamate synthase domain-containing protein 2